MQNDNAYSAIRSVLSLAFLFIILTFGYVSPAQADKNTAIIDAPLVGNISEDDSIYAGKPNVFQWDRDDGAVTQYRLKVRTANKNVIVNQPFNPDTICDLDVCQVDIGVTPGVRLKQNAVYTWQLFTTIDSITTKSPWLSFTNRVLPVDFELIEPSGNHLVDGTRPIFTWVHNENVTTYRVKVWNNLSDKVYFNTELAAEDICSSEELLCQAESMLISGQDEMDNGWFYQWQVTASNPSVRGKSKSLIQGFKILFPGIPTQIDPINRKVVTTTTPTFTWKSVPQAEEYRLTLSVEVATDKIWVSDWMLPGSDGLSCDETVCTFTPESALPLVQGKPHPWQVWARNVPLTKNMSHTSFEKFRVDLNGGLNLLGKQP